VLRAYLKADAASVAALGGKRVLAFAGIGDPARFFATLKASGIEVVRSRAFADHHPFSKAEIDGLIADANRDVLTPVTTEKDLVRLRSGGGMPDWAKSIVPFTVTLEFDDGVKLKRFVTDQLFKARDRKLHVSSSRP
jgi:tetraacyldisaccharide 4'-kinase